MHHRMGSYFEVGGGGGGSIGQHSHHGSLSSMVSSAKAPIKGILSSGSNKPPTPPPTSSIPAKPPILHKKPAVPAGATGLGRGQQQQRLSKGSSGARVRSQASTKSNSSKEGLQLLSSCFFPSPIVFPVKDGDIFSHRVFYLQKSLFKSSIATSRNQY